MSRAAIAGVFALFTAGTVMQLVDHAGGAFAEPSLRAWLVLAFWVLKVAIVAAFAYFVLVRPPARRPARDPAAFAACGAAIVGAVLLRPPSASASTALLLAGDVLAVIAAGWLLVSVLALGRCFGVLPEARGLVTRGPYRLVRHPVYLGELAACAGLTLAALGPFNVICFAVLCVAQRLRMGMEERALEREFPDYGPYAARTPRLIPWSTPPITQTQE
jgi:protein-S-isoprenylcysteine O-methyltransferase Ste14